MGDSEGVGIRTENNRRPLSNMVTKQCYLPVRNQGSALGRACCCEVLGTCSVLLGKIVLLSGYWDVLSIAGKPYGEGLGCTQYSGLIIVP